MPRKQDRDVESGKLLVIMNGPFGIALRDAPGHPHHPHKTRCPKCPDVLVFAADVHDHEYAINRRPWLGTKHHLEGVNSSHDHNRCLSDFGLAGGRVVELDTRTLTFNGSCAPHASVNLPFPDRIHLHRLMDFAYRTGSDPGPHYGAVPGALVFQYDSWTDPVILPDRIKPNRLRIPCECDPTIHQSVRYFFLFAGPTSPAADETLKHSRHAWLQFARHFKDLTFEMFGATVCECVSQARDPVGISDEMIEGLPTFQKDSADGVISVPLHLEAGAANCKHPVSFITNGTTQSLMFTNTN